jgi:hypothetical protein
MTFILGRYVVVKKDSLMTAGETYTFAADHWHELPDGALDIIDFQGDTVGSFRPNKWDYVFFEDAVVDIKERVRS